MNTKQTLPPTTEAESKCANVHESHPTATYCEGKDNAKKLSHQEKRVFYHLLNAKFPQSVADITRSLGVCDARGHIKGLRDKGYNISDMWCYCKDNGRYKRYYIKNPLTM